MTHLYVWYLVLVFGAHGVGPGAVAILEPTEEMCEQLANDQRKKGVEARCIRGVAY